MDKALAVLIKISNIVGKDASLVQGGGGNTSVKTDDGKYMFIKASGTSLKDMDGAKGWRRLKLDTVLSIIEDKSIAKLDGDHLEAEVVNRLSIACFDNVAGGARPSVEAHLHAILDKCVIHLHPNAVGAYVNARNGKDIIGRLFEDDRLPPMWVPYVDPGFTLAKKIFGLLNDYQERYKSKPTIIFLEKHGLFISAKNASYALQLVRRVIKVCGNKLKYTKKTKISPVSNETIREVKLLVRRAFFQATGRYETVSFFMDDAIAAFSKDRYVRNLLSFPALTPDELVYANGPAIWIEKHDSELIARKLKLQIRNMQKPAAAFLVKYVGLFIVGNETVAPIIRDIVKSSLFIRANALSMGGISTLNKRQQDFINNWESEVFRKGLATNQGEGELKNRIAVVTGAGSGLGQSIAIGLAQAGAKVGIADIDETAAAATDVLIRHKFPMASTLIVRCDVTNESAVDNAFDALLDNWGGLDILVNAAGVAPAYPLVDLPVDKWRFAIEVNLTGYFLMARAAARIMLKQQMGGSIINISSKSGLEASMNNTPYNATKAGELHMARGWAIELGEYGIRVNCICPGNVFENSRIWNPEYIKICAKKYNIKPEDVIPYYVNKTALKREIKGQDIADAAVFLASDKARTITGQTIVVDAGQVMVR